MDNVIADYSISGQHSELMSEKIDALGLALSKAQSVMENVSKDKQGYGYKYADLASVLTAIRKPLSDNGLSISQLVTAEVDKHILITLLMHESGQWLKSKFYIENVVMKQCNSLQQIGAGITYTRRYALSAIVGLSQEDDDAQSVPKIKREEELQEKEEKIKELLNLCTEHKISAKEFAEFHNIDSNNINTVKNAITNFEALKQLFLKKE
jgi:hypothetical protein